MFRTSSIRPCRPSADRRSRCDLQSLPAQHVERRRPDAASTFVMPILLSVRASSADRVVVDDQITKAWSGTEGSVGTSWIMMPFLLCTRQPPATRIGVDFETLVPGARCASFMPERRHRREPDFTGESAASAGGTVSGASNRQNLPHCGLPMPPLWCGVQVGEKCDTAYGEWPQRA
jgi:hypothetical protein